MLFLSAGAGVAAMGRLVEVADTKLYVEERGDPSAFPLLVSMAPRGWITPGSAIISTR